MTFKIRVPDLKPGTHTMQMTLDTGTPLGVLETQRTVTVDDPVFGRLAAAYFAATDGGNAEWAAQVRDKLLSLRTMRKLKSGQAIPIDRPCSTNATIPEGFSARVKWYAEDTSLRAVIDVIDADYPDEIVPDTDDSAGFATLVVSPCGPDVRDAVNRFNVRPHASGAARTYSYQAHDYRDVGGVWERTADGYHVEVAIPYDELEGYDQDWEMMPVDAQVSRGGLDAYARFGMNKSTKQGKPAADCAALTKE